MTCNLVSLQMETRNVPVRSINISVSTGQKNVMGHYGMDLKAIRSNGNIVLVNLKVMMTS